MFRIFGGRWKSSAAERAAPQDPAAERAAPQDPAAERAAPQDPAVTAAEFAWRTHNAITDWTAKVDAKASIVLALESAIVAAVITFSGRDRPLSALRGWPLGTYRLGMLSLAIAIVFAGLVVLPQLDRRNARTKWRTGVIYFGHLRRWQPSDLAEHLLALPPRMQLDVLSHQLVITSKIAWVKHARLQWSMLTAAIGTLLVATAGWYR